VEELELELLEDSLDEELSELVLDNELVEDQLCEVLSSLLELE
jgi:hypothetical protein